ncbi:DUF1904 domain-containing protein [Shewanella xiamenensis]|jgi:hypothetical protein|uniref:DUF1904 domain-containing protein n=3 Tax=Shewanella TaxID=22 RepID=Q8EEJ0_SHEON|nr:MULTISPECIES: DUF1904 domain-containing protein [Shewanella]AAN55425.1 protein of unknown function DUF1904 [Shewanella oneidensis MR-1]ASF14411.1 DUF1904 domain-containing protein [Shewanella sp. FDAARGOS_354]KPN75835.1 hypothetical protein AEA42_16830 [Shewanella sp. Sh95]MBW0281290.1 hypothetical protein [Shewanella xiamenensis]MBW0298152.1 hypothetical protein [Shewanella xiamenensis]
MPHISMRGLPQAVVAELSQTLLQSLAAICKGKAESFTLDWIPSISYRNGRIDQRFVQIELLWFPVDPDIHLKVEQTIRLAVTEAYPELTQIAVMFLSLTPSASYRGGQHV